LEVSVTLIKNVVDDFGNIEENYKGYLEIKNKYSKIKVILEKSDAELNGLETKEELLQTQLDKVEEDIEKYYENEDTIESNKQIELKIKELENERKGVENKIHSICNLKYCGQEFFVYNDLQKNNNVEKILCIQKQKRNIGNRILNLLTKELLVFNNNTLITYFVWIMRLLSHFI
jgi:chromosome segregation ATPase